MSVSLARTPKYRRHKPTGQAVVTLGGRDFYLGKHNTAASRERYRRLVAEYLQTGQPPGADRQKTRTVSEVIAAYWKHAKAYYVKDGQPSTEVGLIRSVCRIVRPLYGRTPAVEFGPRALKAVRQAMIDRGWSRKNINAQVSRIRRMFKWAAAEKLIPASVPQALEKLAGLRRGRTEAPDPKPVPLVLDATIDATAAHLPEVVGDMVRLQRVTGMRPAEVCLMRPCDIDRSREVWVYRPESHKTEHHGRDPAVLLGPRAQEILLRYLVRDADAYCFRPCDSEGKRLAARHAARVTPISCGDRPGSNRRPKPKRAAVSRYSWASYRRAIHRACDKAGMERWSPNRLRHTAATAFRARFGLEAAQVLLGHAGAELTQVYAERDLGKGIEVAKVIG